MVVPPPPGRPSTRRELFDQDLYAYAGQQAIYERQRQESAIHSSRSSPAPTKGTDDDGRRLAQVPVAGQHRHGHGGDASGENGGDGRVGPHRHPGVAADEGEDQ